MLAISQYLGRSGVKAGLIQEPALDSFGVSVTESAIQLKEENIDTIRLVRTSSGSCSSGEALRFQYKLRLENDLPADLVPKLKARTKTIKVGKVLGLFGGKIVDVKWTGQELADLLNQDTEVSQVLLRCMQILEEMDLNIEAASSSEIYISGPWFINPSTIIALYSPGKALEEQNCIFSYKTIDRIAKHIQDLALKTK